jgi:hypothetical protein
MPILTRTLQSHRAQQWIWESHPACCERRRGRGRQVWHGERDIGGIAPEILPHAFLAAEKKIVSGAKLDALVLGQLLGEKSS